MGGWLDLWFERFYCVGVEASTAGTAESNIRVYLKPALGCIPLQKLSTEDVQGFIQKELDAGLASSTIRRYLKLLRQSLKQAVILRRIPRDPT